MPGLFLRYYRMKGEKARRAMEKNTESGRSDSRAHSCESDAQTGEQTRELKSRRSERLKLFKSNVADSLGKSR
jgi:hypothetical protein